jgi:probable phosphoglycerate mutase
MSSDLPKLYLARHGDTDWTDSHQHTGRTDLPLNERGEGHARQLGERLRGSRLPAFSPVPCGVPR